MDLATFAHQMVGAIVAQNNSRLVEVDDVAIVLGQMFPELSKAEITSWVVRDVEEQDRTIAWIGHA